MKQNKIRKYLIITAILLVAINLIGFALISFAASTVSVTNIPASFNGITFSAESTYAHGSSTCVAQASFSGNTLTVKAQGYQTSSACNTTNYDQTVTVTLTNNGSAAVTLSFTCTDATASAASGTQLAVGSSITFTVTGGASSTTSGVIAFGAPVWASASVTVTVKVPDSAKGSVKVDDVAITADKTVKTTNQKSIALSATANGTFVFHGWMNVSTGEYLAYENGSFTFQSSCTVMPVFRYASSAMFQTNGMQYAYLDHAITAASNGDKTVVLVTGGSAYHSEDTTEFEIPADVTLLLPYSASSSTWTCDSATGTLEYANYEAFAGGGIGYASPASARITMTLQSGYTLKVKGKVVVGGHLETFSDSWPLSTEGNFARLQLDKGSKLYMDTNSVLSVCGFVSGEGEIDAQQSGVTVYQPFSMIDYPGGQESSDTYNGKTVFPFSQYTLNNIQAKITLSSVSSMKIYQGMYIASTVDDNVLGTSAFIGPYTSDAPTLISLDSGSTLEITYDATKCVRKNTGRLVFTLNGNASFRSISITVNKGILSTTTINSNYATLPLPYTVSIQCMSGVTTLYEDLSVYPGAEIYVGPEAELVVSDGVKFTVLDGLVDHGNTAYSPYATWDVIAGAGLNPMGNLIVDGKLTVNATATFGGIVQTRSDSAVIDIKSGATLSTVLQNSYLSSSYTNATKHTLTAMAYNSVNGGLVNLTAGTIYYGHADPVYTKTSFSYDLYTSTSAYTTQKVTYSATVEGEWYTHRVIYQDVDGKDIVDYEYNDQILDYTVYYISSTGDIYSPLTDPELFVYDDGVYLYATSWGTPSALQTPTAGSPYYLIQMVKGERNGILAELQQKYRLNSYIWFNGIVIIDDSILALDTVKGKEFVVYAADGETKLTDIQAFEAGGTVYVVRKILSNEITSKISFRLQIDGVLTNVMTIDFSNYNAGALSELKAAMLEYGAAADLFFDKEWKDDMEVAPFLESWTGMQKAIKNQEAPATDAYNGVLSVKTKGANFVFDESLMMKIRFQVGDVTDYTSQIVQIGVLVGDPAGILTTLEGEHTAAYVLYNKTAFGSSDASTPEGLPSDYVYSSGTNSVITDISALNFDEPLVVSFDLLSKEYTQNFGIRPYLVLNVGTDEEPQYVAVYGAQYTYGFDAYVYTMYHKSSDELTDSFDDAELNPDAFKNFLVYAWKYAEASAAANKES